MPSIKSGEQKFHQIKLSGCRPFATPLVADGGAGGPGGGETNAGVAAETPAEDTTTPPKSADKTSQDGIQWDEQEDLGEVIDMQACVDGGFVDQAATPEK